MPRIKTLQVAAHCSSWGPFTYIQDQVSWPIALVVAHLLIYTTNPVSNRIYKFTYIQDQVASDSRLHPTGRDGGPVGGGGSRTHLPFRAAQRH